MQMTGEWDVGMYSKKQNQGESEFVFELKVTLCGNISFTCPDKNSNQLSFSIILYNPLL